MKLNPWLLMYSNRTVEHFIKAAIEQYTGSCSDGIANLCTHHVS